jgi:hypothetical protein
MRKEEGWAPLELERANMSYSPNKKKSASSKLRVGEGLTLLELACIFLFFINDRLKNQRIREFYYHVVWKHVKFF